LGPDPLRLYLTKEIGFGQDGDFSWDRFEEHYNVDLANNFGNLVSRVVSMGHRYRNGRLVVPSRETGPLSGLATEAVASYRRSMDEYALHRAIATAFGLIDSTNEYIASVEPWSVAKDTQRAEELDRQLCDMVESVRIVATLLSPVMPSACGEIMRRIGCGTSGALNLDRDGVWQTPPGSERQLEQAGPLWPRLEPERVAPAVKGSKQKETKTMNEDGKQVESPESALTEASTISIDDFFKVELRVGRVVAAEPIPKSRKLLKLDIETGSGVRQIVSGIAKAYEPEALIGRHVVFVANLKAATLMGVESNGMVLAATDSTGNAVLIEPEDVERAPAGSEVR
jgi:methionyl-tRNA synthetase